MSRSSLSTSTELMLGGMLVAISVRWFITPMRHPHAAGWKVAIVVAELAIGLGLIGYAVMRHSRGRRAEPDVEVRGRVG